MLPDGCRLLKNKYEIAKLLLPMVPDYCESIKHKNSYEDVVKLMMDTENIQSFVFMNDLDSIGFSTYMISTVVDEIYVHQCHGYFKPEYKEHAGKMYDLTKILANGMKANKLTMGFFNKKLAKKFVDEFKKRNIDLNFLGYFYQANLPKE